MRYYNMNEFADIPGFNNYVVSRSGEVRNKTTGRVLTTSVTQYYTPYVSLLDDEGFQHTRSLPLLVATLFLPNDNPHFDTPIQLDNDVMNCHVDNLMWRPRWFARKYNGQFRDPTVWESYPIFDRASGEVFETARDCAMRFGLIQADIIRSIAFGTPVWPTQQVFEAIQP